MAEQEENSRVRDAVAVNEAMNYLKPEELAEIKEAFQLFEVDNEGYIPTDQLKRAMHAMGENPSDTEIMDFIDEFDLERAGKIEFPEFVVILVRKLQDTGEDELKQAFLIFDTDGDGFISPSELRIIMTSFGERLTDEEVDEMILESDWNGDRQIDFEEFVDMMVSSPRRKQDFKK